MQEKNLTTTEDYQRFLDFAEHSKPHLANSALFKWGSMLVTLVTMFVMTPFIINHLGKYGYGLWTISTSLIGYYGVLNLGVTSAVSRFVSLSLGKKDLNALGRAFNTAFFVFIGTGLFIAVLVQFVAPAFSAFFKVQNTEEFEYLVRMMGLSVAISFPTSVMISVIIAHECYKLQSIVAISNTILRAALTVYFLWHGYGIKGLAHAFIITSVVDFVLNLLIVKTFLPWSRISAKGYSFTLLKEMIIFGIPTVIISVSVLLRTELNSAVIGNMIGIEEVAIYGIAALIMKNIFNLINAGLGVFTPRYARLAGAGKDIVELFTSSLFYAAVLALGAAGIVFLFAEKFIHLWIGSGFDSALPILWILMVCYVVTLMQIPGYNLLMAINKHKIFAMITFLEGVANLVISIALAPKYGLVGVALGTAIPMLFVKIFLQPYFVIRASNITLRRYLSPMLVPTGIGSLFIGAGLLFGLPEQISDANWAGLAGVVSIYGLSFMAVIFALTYFVNPQYLRLSTDKGRQVRTELIS